MTFVSNANPAFRSRFSENIFQHKYAHEGAETWDQLCTTLANEVCGGLLPQDDIDQLARYMQQMKFIPGGRYLYYAGRPNPFYNNCLRGDTRLLTDRGMVRMDALEDGEAVHVYSPVEGTFLPATMHTHGEQDIYEITFQNVRGRSSKTWKAYATADHRWPTKNRGEVIDLRVGDVVPAASVNLPAHDRAYLHGMVFADGNVHELKEHYGHQLRLCGKKSGHLPFVEAHGKVSYPPFAGGDPVAYIRSEHNMKLLPETNDPSYIASFLRGWVSLDGHAGSVHQIHTVDRDAMDFFVEHAHLAGFIVSGEVLCEMSPSNFGGRKPLWRVNFRPADSFSGFKVVSKKKHGREVVYCPFEPKHNRIVIDHGMDTYQCYLFRSEEDTREDWANLSWKVESALMTGGGIGNDYSRYRERGALIRRTGGFASGPIPKMEMTNEIGRRVMQGGSRRSALYASLNWRHADFEDFLHAKDWDTLPVAGTGGLTIGDLKRADFNYPAPLDMTNISGNYDTAWLEQYQRTGDVGPEFLENIAQALRTAEPGFSFNFHEKENETLRNACTEVTSEDDSDVCNLGSLNLGRIEDLEELADVTFLATQFLLCGTLKAKLPFDKVYAVREKNRRLGLGLMGVHEWLIKRGHRYEVTGDLHQWLAVYRSVSDLAAKATADRLSVSVPVAKRAIAPTGTIGILAGTSTGIEPIFAVAYKRRYLKGQSDWHYEYVVDGAAQELIELYGADPDKIESAIDLAADYERRIKFQADVQDYVDQSISSTINLPAWGSALNNEDTVKDFAKTVAKYAHRLRGLTVYPDGARGGQPLTSVPYSLAKEYLGQTFQEAVQTHDICDISGKGGSCGV